MSINTYVNTIIANLSKIPFKYSDLGALRIGTSTYNILSIIAHIFYQKKLTDRRRTDTLHIAHTGWNNRSRSIRSHIYSQ